MYSSSFILLSLKPIQSFSGCVFGNIAVLKCPHFSHVHHLGRWQQIFIKNVLVHFAFHPFFNYTMFNSTVCWKAAPNFTVCMLLRFFGAVLSFNQSIIIHIMASKVWSHLTRLFSQYFTGQMLCSKASTCFFFSNGVLGAVCVLWPQQCSLEHLEV